MSTQTVSIPLSATTTTLHRNWANAISAALTALGLTKTSDTGQIVLTGTTLAYPASPTQGQSQYSGYEIRQMVASGLPTIYLKVWYGIYYNTTGTGANYYWPALRIDVGSATNGAGVLTTFNSDGVDYGAIQSSGSMTGSLSASSGRPSATAQNCYLASDGANYLTIGMGSAAPAFETSAIMVSALERTNTPGATTFTYDSGGLVAVNLPATATDTLSNSAAKQTLWDFTTLAEYLGTTISGQTTSYLYRPNASTSASQFPITVGVGHGPMLSAIAEDPLVAENTSYPLTLYGAAHTFQSYLRAGGTYADPFNSTSLSLRFD